MLVKKVPYVGKWKLSDPKLVKRQTAKDYTYPSKIRVSTECRKLIELLLEPNPANRITINRALAHPWFDKVKPVSKSHSKKSSDKSCNSSENFRKQTTDMDRKREAKSTKSTKSTNSNRSTGSKSSRGKSQKAPAKGSSKKAETYESDVEEGDEDKSDTD